MDYDKKIHPAILFSLIFFFSVSTIFFLLSQYNREEIMPAKGKTALSGRSGEVIVAFDFGNGVERKFKGPVVGNSKAWDVFQRAIDTGKIDVRVSGNFVPQSIDGYKNGDSGKEWNLYLNNIKREFDPFNIGTASGDIVVFKFE